jgi:hypothetical protein
VFKKKIVIGETENLRGWNVSDLFQEFGLINFTIQIFLKNRTKIISVFEQTRAIIKQFRKPERSDIDEALLKWFKKRRSNVPVSGPLLMVTLFFLNCKFKSLYYLS